MIRVFPEALYPNGHGDSPPRTMKRRFAVPVSPPFCLPPDRFRALRGLLPFFLAAGMLAGCDTLSRIGPHRIDVQQGNDLDQENVSRLKLGLSRSQVRFLLGTPLVVDPFRNDRWDYVYVFYKAGVLAEQRRISLFFDGETLIRIEGDLPDAAPAAQPAPAVRAPAEPDAVASPPTASPVPPPTVEPAPRVEPPPRIKPAPVVKSGAPARDTAGAAAGRPVVPPLPSPPGAPPYVDPRTPPEPPPGLMTETDIERIQPDVIPPFPEPPVPASATSAPASDEALRKTVNDWAHAWAARDLEAYLAAYDADFAPQDGVSRNAWETQRRRVIGAAGRIELRIENLAVERTPDGGATVTFNQRYRSRGYRDAVVKQLRLVERDGRWGIVEEKVLSPWKGERP